MEDSTERWLQLAEMALDGEESKALCSGEMEKSCCGCDETLLGLLRMLITCKHSRENVSGGPLSTSSSTLGQITRNYTINKILITNRKLKYNAIGRTTKKERKTGERANWMLANKMTLWPHLNHII